MESLNEILKMDNPSEYLYDYAFDNGRLEPKWERLLLSLEDPEWIYCYAMYIIKGRWPEAEEYIIKDPRYACWYAEDAIKGRWLEAEEFIKKDEYWWEKYCNYLKLQQVGGKMIITHASEDKSIKLSLDTSTKKVTKTVNQKIEFILPISDWAEDYYDKDANDRQFAEKLAENKICPMCGAIDPDIEILVDTTLYGKFSDHHDIYDIKVIDKTEEFAHGNRIKCGECGKYFNMSINVDWEDHYICGSNKHGVFLKIFFNEEDAKKCIKDFNSGAHFVVYKK